MKSATRRASLGVGGGGPPETPELVESALVEDALEVEVELDVKLANAGEAAPASPSPSPPP